MVQSTCVAFTELQYIGGGVCGEALYTVRFGGRLVKEVASFSTEKSVQFHHHLAHVDLEEGTCTCLK